MTVTDSLGNTIGTTQGIGNSLNVTVPEGDSNNNTISYTFAGSWIDLGQTPTISNTVAFLELSPQGVVGVSDLLSYSAFSADGFGHITATFTSGFLGNAADSPPPGAMLWNENAGPFVWGLPFLSSSIVSDPEPTPEPSTLAIAGLSGLGLLIFRLRRKAL